MALLTGCFSRNEILTSEENLPAVTGDMLTEAASEATAEAPIVSDQPYEYISKDKWFSFTLPAKRTFQENVFGSLVMFFAPQEEWDKIKENLGVTIEELTGDVNLTSFFELTKGNVESVIRDYKAVKEEAMTINGNDAMKIIYKGTQSEQKLQWQEIIVLKWTTAYVFTYTATEDTFNDFIDEVDTIINTFQIN